MAKKEKETLTKELDNFENVLGNSEAFIEKNKERFLIGLLAVVIIVVGFLCVNTFYLEPNEQNAAESISKPEQLFAQDSFRLALEGNEDVIGFLEIIDEYGSTSTGNLAKAYAGICYKQLGDYNNAISYLSKFDGDDNLISPAILGSIADCYWDLGEKEKAISYYLKAANEDNAIITPLYKKRAAIIYLSLGENQKAIDLLESVIVKYPKSSEISDVTRYLEYAKSTKK